MSQPEPKDRSMKWMGLAMIACCAIPIAISLFLGGGLGLFLGRSSQQPNSNPLTSASTPQPKPQQKAVNVSLSPAANWQTNNHVHGLAVDRDNPKIIYVASHNGLLQRSEAGQWFWMGKQRADYMGFTADPTNSNRFYSSGHPPTGGNLGFQVSKNQGEDWQQISLPGVDFHALAIAPSNPNIFYGFPASGAQGLHLSKDGGKTWTKPPMVGLNDAPFDLAVDPNHPAHVFAATRSGIYKSTNNGDEWKLVPDTQNAPVIALALLKQGDSTVMYGYRFVQSAPGIYRSNDSGKTWEKLWTETGGVVVKLAISPSNSQNLYAVNENNLVFQSQDGGKTWQKLS